MHIAGKRGLGYFEPSPPQLASQLVLVGNRGLCHQLPDRIVPEILHLALPPDKVKARLANGRPRLHKYTTNLNKYAMSARRIHPAATVNSIAAPSHSGSAFDFNNLLESRSRVVDNGAVLRYQAKDVLRFKEKDLPP